MSLENAETVLLVEDDEAVRAVARRALERYGYRVLAAPGGDEALRLAQEHEGEIHLLLTDIMMPGMNGVEVAGRVVRMRPGTGSSTCRATRTRTWSARASFSRARTSFRSLSHRRNSGAGIGTS